MNQYIAFISAVEHGSFTKAAEQLGYTQSAISQHIKSLEQELGATLILRSRSGITLTADGESYYPYIKNIELAKKELDEKKNRMHGLERATIKIGVIASIATKYLPRWMKQFKEQYPNVQFELIMGNYTEIESMILNGDVDFGFVNPVAVTKLQTLPLFQDEFLVCLNVANRLVDEDAIPIERLLKETYILVKDGAVNEAHEFFTQQGHEPNIEYVVSDDKIVLQMIAENLGVSIIPSLAIQTISNDVVTKSLYPKRHRAIHIAYKDESILPIATRTFIQALLNYEKVNIK